MKLLLMLEVETNSLHDKTQNELDLSGELIARVINNRCDDWGKFKCKKVELVEEAKPV